MRWVCLSSLLVEELGSAVKAFVWSRRLFGLVAGSGAGLGLEMLLGSGLRCLLVYLAHLALCRHSLPFQTGFFVARVRGFVLVWWM